MIKLNLKVIRLKNYKYICKAIKKRSNPMCYKHCASAICFFMNSNRRNALLQLVFSFCMLDDVEINNKGEQYSYIGIKWTKLYFVWTITKAT